MQKLWALCLVAMAMPAFGADVVSEEIRFETRDGVSVYGDLYRADATSSAPLILLFHQAGGDARGEYGSLVGRLVDAGYHAMAIDQRVGGDRFGGENRTQSGVGDKEYGYCEVYPDIEGALRHARALGFSGEIIAWGSSYSAALVFQLAAMNSEDITAIMAFSPASGGPLVDCPPSKFSSSLPMPVLVLRPAREMEVPSVPPQMERFRADGHQTYVSDPGVHGSSMLDADRVGESTEEAWAEVFRFLRESTTDPM